MSFQRLGEAGSEIPVYEAGSTVFDLRGIATDIDAAFFSGGGVARARAARSADELIELDGANTMRIGPPIARPAKIVCIGLNYSDHAEETGTALPAEPVVFLKDPLTVVGPFDDVLIPRSSVKTDWEVELGIVVGQTARYLESPDDADAVIAGYVLSHDVSERDGLDPVWWTPHKRECPLWESRVGSSLLSSKTRP
ncbi:fumarylacetoacetate hydrolase family protein [Subtercola sp. RTI3]|nr:fumarylacetoacetate hydrolase family protein [Subtercola sp. RTI3]MEA9984269.1 fumarylacetoacetate hydrolase family protein [Subtercola sp. RTI3]